MYTVIISAEITLTAANRKTAQDITTLFIIDRAYSADIFTESAEIAECRKAIAPLLKVYSEYSDIGLDLRLADSHLSNIEWERSAERKRLKEWLNNPANWDSEEYSDIHKEVYGYRP